MPCVTSCKSVSGKSRGATKLWVQKEIDAMNCTHLFIGGSLSGRFGLGREFLFCLALAAWLRLAWWHCCYQIA
jgi:hypothetical protein